LTDAQTHICRHLHCVHGNASARAMTQIFMAWKGVTCNGIRLTLWKPYNLKGQKHLNFWRITANPPDTPIAHLKGKITIGEVDVFPDLFLNGERCMDDNPKRN
jgi:hypothetical protein